MQKRVMLAIAIAAIPFMAARADVPSPEPAPPVQAVPSPAGSGGAPPVAVSAPVPAPSGFATPVACDNAGFLALQAEHPSGYREVTVCGNVAQVLPEKTTASGKHKYFFVTLDAAGDTIEIVTNVDVTGEFDVRVGGLANIHGRYYRDAIGSQGIDWTHHNNAGAAWPYPGYVQLDGGPLID